MEAHLQAQICNTATFSAVITQLKSFLFLYLEISADLFQLPLCTWHGLSLSHFQLLTLSHDFTCCEMNECDFRMDIVGLFSFLVHGVPLL